MKRLSRFIFVVGCLIVLAAPRSLQGASVSIVADFTPAPDGVYPDVVLQGKDGDIYGITEFAGTYNGGSFFKVDHSGNFTLLGAFGGKTGVLPLYLTIASDGTFYGATSSGALTGSGAIFKAPPTGPVSYLTVTVGLNLGPAGPVYQGLDGNFYGVSNVDLNSNWFFYKMTPAGALTVLGQFNTSVYGFPNLYLARGTDGSFYGTTYSRTAGVYGSVFKVTTAGALTILDSFNGTTGSRPVGGLTLDGSFFYGVTSAGGTANAGTIYKVSTTGSITLLHSFDGTIAKAPTTGLFLGHDGFLYGTTSKNGNPGTGPVYKISTAGTYSIVRPDAGINITSVGTDGNFYGVGGELNGAAGSVEEMTPSGTLTTLYTFTSPGQSIPSSIMQASNGNFYGTALNTIFQLTPSGALSTYGVFPPAVWDFVNPGLVEGPGGVLYGSSYDDYGYEGYGKIYKIASSGTVTPIYAFTAPTATYGASPLSGLTLGKDGYLYSTTAQGGSANVGTVIKVSTTGTLTTVASLPSTLPGSGITSPVVQGTSGSFYGSDDENGSFFKVTTAGAVLPFASLVPPVGTMPSGLYLGNDTNLYLTGQGSTNPSVALFKLTIDGKLTTVASSTSTGSGDYFPPVKAADGNFYGTTKGTIDPDDNGAIFSVSSTGSFTTVATLDPYGPSSPQSPLIKAKDGTLYGVAGGGQSGYGSIFRIDPNATFTANFPSATAVPLTTSDFMTGNTSLALTLGFSPAAGTVLTVIKNIGLGPINGNFLNLPDGGTIQAIFGATTYTFTADYEGGSGGDLTLTLTSVGTKTKQTINFFSPGNQVYGAVATLDATASSGLPVTFSVIDGPAKVSGNKVTFSQTGTITIEAVQNGDATYASASALQVFEVTKAPQTIKPFGPAPQLIYPSSPVNLASYPGFLPTASSRLPVYLRVTSGPATVSGTTLTPTGTGSVTLSGTQPGNINYQPATPVSTGIRITAQGAGAGG